MPHDLARAIPVGRPSLWQRPVRSPDHPCRARSDGRELVSRPERSDESEKSRIAGIPIAHPPGGRHAHG
eukprot:scaffold1517_cov397-Prasinococcus_capsulatus_cf.AAC.1